MYVLCYLSPLGNILKTSRPNKHFGLFLPEMHNSKLPDEQMIMINTNFHQSNFFKGRPKEFLLN